MPPVERRKQPRTYTDLSVEVCVLASKTRLQGRVLDLASEGIAVFSPEYLHAGDAISITYRGVLILAEVEYCIALNKGYRAGARIDQAMATVHADLSVDEATLELRELTAGTPAELLLTRAAHA